MNMYFTLSKNQLISGGCECWYDPCTSHVSVVYIFTVLNVLFMDEIRVVHCWYTMYFNSKMFYLHRHDRTLFFYLVQFKIHMCCTNFYFYVTIVALEVMFNVFIWPQVTLYFEMKGYLKYLWWLRIKNSILCIYVNYMNTTNVFIVLLWSLVVIRWGSDRFYLCTFVVLMDLRFYIYRGQIFTSTAN